MLLSRLFIYPVKSLAGVEVDAWPVDDFGLMNDRRWMIVDELGIALTQRERARLALIKPTLFDGGITLTAPTMPPLVSQTPVNCVRPVTVWDDTVDVGDAGPEAREWLTDFIGEPASLVYMSPDCFRRIDPAYSADARRVSFSDGYPFLLISQESMDELNRRMETPLGIERFRPNLVVSGAAHPNAEDEWKRIRIGSLELDVVKPCARCAVPTVDPKTAERGKEPSRTLATYRKRDGKVYFGQNLIHRGSGELRVGDAAVVVE